MSDYTKEPWKVNEIRTCGLIDFTIDSEDDLICESVNRVNANRIVAAVNACKGFTTESLLNCTSDDKPNWKLVIFAETKDGTKLTIYSDAYDKDLGELK